MNEFLWESASSDAFLARLARDARADQILCTHTGLHWQRELPESGVRIVNVGAVGRPANDGLRVAWYAWFAPECHDATFIPVAYDALAVAAEMDAEGLPAEFGETIRTGWWTTCLEILPAKGGPGAAGRWPTRSGTCASTRRRCAERAGIRASTSEGCSSSGGAVDLRAPLQSLSRDLGISDATIGQILSKVALEPRSRRCRGVPLPPHARAHAARRGGARRGRLRLQASLVQPELLLVAFLTGMVITVFRLSIAPVVMKEGASERGRFSSAPRSAFSSSRPSSAPQSAARCRTWSTSSRPRAARRSGSACSRRPRSR